MEKLEGLALLRAPFPAHQISKLPKPTKSKDDMAKLPKSSCSICGGYHPTTNIIHLDYVGHAALTDRLLDVDPNWFWEPVAFGADGLPAFDKIGGLWVRLTVLGMSRLGYGNPDGKTGGNAIKEAIGDALRNAAMRFGAALDLWHKGDLHLDDSDEGGIDQSTVAIASNVLPQSISITGEQVAELRNGLNIIGITEADFLHGKPYQFLEQMPASSFKPAMKKIKDLAGVK